MLEDSNADGRVDSWKQFEGGVCTLQEIDTDFDGDLRGDQPDIGADELGIGIFADGFESGDTSAWSAGVP